jgi:hypothetical protein
VSEVRATATNNTNADDLRRISAVAPTELTGRPAAAVPAVVD